MGTAVIGTLIDDCRRTLFELKVGQDAATDVRYDRTRELLPIANAVQKVICLYRREACVKTAPRVLDDGILQTIPADGQALRKPEYNLGADGATVGRSIELIDRTVLARIDPEWTTASGDAVELFVFDQENPRQWLAYPRPSGTWSVMESYFAIPADIAAADIDDASAGLIAVDDVFIQALKDGIVAYALAKNSTRAGATGRASFFANQFAQALGVSAQTAMTGLLLDQPAAEATPNGRP